LSRDTTARIPQPRAEGETLIDFQYPGSPNDGGFLLSIGKPRRSFPVDVNPRELFAIFIKDGHLPVAVFAAPVVLQAGTLFSSRLFVFFHELSRILKTVWRRNYVNFLKSKQVDLREYLIVDVIRGALGLSHFLFGFTGISRWFDPIRGPLSRSNQ